MYPKNAASPPTIAIGALINVSTGAVTTTGASVTVTPQGGSETAGGGTLACLGTSGIWQYTPTQAETNYTAFTVAVYESGCIPVAVTVVTSANSTAGYPGGVPAIAAGAKSGLPVLDSSTGLLLSGYGGGLVGMNVTEWNGTAVGGLPPTAAAIATAVWTDTTSGDFTTSGSAGKELLTTIPAAIAAIPTNPYTGTPPTAAAIATAVWQDTTAGDFGTSGSAGKELLTTIPAAIAAIPTNPYTGTPPTAAAIATAVWTDTTSGDFTTSGSPGKELVTTIPAAIAAIPTNPYTGTPPTAAAIATAVWTDTTSGDFTTSGSAGAVLIGIAASIPSAATIARAVWQDATAGDFTINGSAGKELKTTLPAAVAAIPTNPYTGTPPTAAAIASAVWQDTTAGDFTVAHSVGSMVTNIGSGTVAFSVNALANAPSGGGGGGGGGASASEVWEDTFSGGDFDTAGSVGAALMQFLTGGPLVQPPSLVQPGGAIELEQYASYKAERGNAVAITINVPFDLTGADVHLWIAPQTNGAPVMPPAIDVAGCTVEGPTTAATGLSADISGAETGGLSPCSPYAWCFVAYFPGGDQVPITAWSDCTVAPEWRL